MTRASKFLAYALRHDVPPEFLNFAGHPPALTRSPRTWRPDSATWLDSFRGVALLQRGTEELMAVAGGTTGTNPDTDCTLGTRFQIASVSKQFTAAALLLLADRGIVAVDDAVPRLGLMAARRAGTRSRCITCSPIQPGWCTRGIFPNWTLTTPIAADEEVRTFQDAPLLSAPGERYSYSSPGYAPCSA